MDGSLIESINKTILDFTPKIEKKNYSYQTMDVCSYEKDITHDGKNTTVYIYIETASYPKEVHLKESLELAISNSSTSQLRELNGSDMFNEMLLNHQEQIIMDRAEEEAESGMEEDGEQQTYQTISVKYLNESDPFEIYRVDLVGLSNEAQSKLVAVQAQMQSSIEQRYTELVTSTIEAKLSGLKEKELSEFKNSLYSISKVRQHTSPSRNMSL